MSTIVVRHRVGIAGRVTDALSGQALPGVRVEIAAAPAAFLDLIALRAVAAGNLWAALPERVDRTRTARDGHYHFLDLPAGAYMLAASLPEAGSRYGIATLPLTLTADSLGNVGMGNGDLALPPTAVQGKVSSLASLPGAVPMAEVSIGGSGEKTFCDAAGAYRLAGIEAGARTVVVAARGFAPKSQAVNLAQPGAVLTLDLALTPSP